MGRRLTWNNFLNSDRGQGDMGQSIISDWLDVDGREFSIQLVWTGAAAPVGSTPSFVFETNNDGATADSIDPSLLTPSPIDVTGAAGHQTLHFPGIRVRQVRVKYNRSSAGAADVLRGYVVPGVRV